MTTRKGRSTGKKVTATLEARRPKPAAGGLPGGDEELPVATPEMVEPVEPDPAERRAAENAETDIAPDRVDAELAEERTADSEACGLPDESVTAASDLG
jgi:hypothetical protein